jgi:hypothetical protein
MRASLRLAVSLAVVIGTGLTATAASAATNAPATLARGLAASDDAPTTVTFSVNVGALTITAPASISLGSGDPGTTITHNLGGNVVVTDLRASLGGTWTATASSTDWTTGTGTTPETIPAGDASYTPGTITVTGTSNAATQGLNIAALSGDPQDVITATVTGNNTATWDPTIAVAVPAAAVGGTYTATLTQSVA